MPKKCFTEDSFIQASHCGGGETQGRITTVGPLNSISSNQHLKAIKSSLLHSMISLWWAFYYTHSGLLKLPRKSCRVQMNKCLITKKPLLLFACSCAKPPRKAGLGRGIPPCSPHPEQIPSWCSREAVWLQQGPCGLPSSVVSTAVPALWALLLFSLLLPEPILWQKQGDSFFQCGGLEKHGLISDKAQRGEWFEVRHSWLTKILK